MANLVSYQAILFPFDDRMPHLVSLSTSAIDLSGMHMVSELFRSGRIPHPEVFMDYITEETRSQAWSLKVIDSLDGMSQKLTTPYIVFYATVSRDGMPFPVNKYIREVQGRPFFQLASAWRGSIVVAKYSDLQYARMVDASMADFPIVKNWFQTHRME